MFTVRKLPQTLHLLMALSIKYSNTHTMKSVSTVTGITMQAVKVSCIYLITLCTKTIKRSGNSS